MPADHPHRTIVLPGEIDLEAFRSQARTLMAAGVPPGDVQWHVAGAADLFSKPSPGETLPDPATAPVGGTLAASRVPPAFLTLCQQVILHHDAGRFGLLYRLLWRLVHEPGLRHDPLDPDLLQAGLMAKAVRRDRHKMTAFVRFTAVDDGGVTPLHVAWFEPEHHIVEATAPFFQRRFANMRWAILTPGRSVRWEPPELVFAAGGRREDAPPADAGETLWLTYYASIFNPARLKLAMMQKEMPRRYWHNLPEARLISELSARALERSSTMVQQPATIPKRRIPHTAHVHALQAAPNGEQPVTIHRLSDLKAATDRCRECPIGAFATQSVVGEGPKHARLMVVGEQPGDQEDLRGQPFVGPAGKLFDKAVAELGWDRARLYVTNAVKHFKFELRGKRRMHKTPAQQEIDACLHWLEDEMALVAPRAILALGGTAARAVLGRPVAVMKERGQWLTDPRGLPVLVTLHPSALLRADPAHGKENFDHWLDDLRLATTWATAA
jgi:probable DNA metabolism protein